MENNVFINTYTLLHIHIFEFVLQSPFLILISNIEISAFISVNISIGAFQMQLTSIFQIFIFCKKTYSVALMSPPFYQW